MYCHARICAIAVLNKKNCRLFSLYRQTDFIDQKRMSKFFSFEQHREYIKIIRLCIPAIEDYRLLPREKVLQNYINML